MKPTSYLMISVLIALGPLCGHAQDNSIKTPTLKELELEYNVSRSTIIKPIRNLQASYQSQLEKLREEMKTAGNLERILAIDKELKNFRNEKTKQTELGFQKLNRLQTIYTREAIQRSALAKKKLPIVVADHKRRLQSLQKELARQDKLKEAIEVKEALANVDETLGIYVPSASDKLSPQIPAVVEWSGKTKPFAEGELQFTNRGYVWTDVPKKYQKWKISMQAGGSQIDSKIKVKTRGLVYIVVDPTVEKEFNSNGWKSIEVLKGGGRGVQEYIMVEKVFKTGRYTISGEGWLTTRILLPNIEKQ